MKTYLIIWHSSDGENPLEVMGKLTRIGFEPVTGQYDLVYDHGRDVDVVEIMDLAIMVHETLKGTGVMYKIETPK